MFCTRCCVPALIRRIRSGCILITSWGITPLLESTRPCLALLEIGAQFCREPFRPRCILRLLTSHDPPHPTSFANTRNNSIDIACRRATPMSLARSPFVLQEPRTQWQFRCRSSGVEHSLGKGEVESSILSGSTSFSGFFEVRLCRSVPERAENIRPFPYKTRTQVFAGCSIARGAE